jgi:hypothetical protein
MICAGLCVFASRLADAFQTSRGCRHCCRVGETHLLSVAPNRRIPKQAGTPAPLLRPRSGQWGGRPCPPVPTCRVGEAHRHRGDCRGFHPPYKRPRKVSADLLRTNPRHCCRVGETHRHLGDWRWDRSVYIESDSPHGNFRMYPLLSDAATAIWFPSGLKVRP